MITFPSSFNLPQALVYPDSADPELVYVDLRSPAAVHPGHAFRWLPIPNASLETAPIAYLTGEMRFGPGGEGFESIPGLPGGVRLLPVPWEQGPVAAWVREGERAHLVAQGKTSGFGASNAILNGTAPLKAMISPVCVAVELSCKARLREGEAHGEGRAEAVRELLAAAALVEQAEWDSSLAEVLLEALRVMRAGGGLTLEVRAGSADPAARDELEGLAMLEWAHRLAAWLGPHVSLAEPAGRAQWKELAAPPALSIHWRTGDVVTLRSVKKTIEQATTV